MYVQISVSLNKIDKHTVIILQYIYFFTLFSFFLQADLPLSFTHFYTEIINNV